MYEAQIRLRAAVHDPRRNALWAEIRRAKDLARLALGSRRGRTSGLPPALDAQERRLESLLEELRSSYSDADEGRPERLAELDRVGAGLRRMFDECRAIAGLPRGPARSARAERFLRELHLSKATRDARSPVPMVSRVDPRAGRTPGLHGGAEPRVDVPLPTRRRQPKP